MIFLLLLSTLSSDMILERDVRHESNFPIPLHYSTIFYLRAFWGVPQLRHKNKHLTFLSFFLFLKWSVEAHQFKWKGS